MQVAYGLIRDVKGYHIHFWLSSNSSTEQKKRQLCDWAEASRKPNSHSTAPNRQTLKIQLEGNFRFNNCLCSAWIPGERGCAKNPFRDLAVWGAGGAWGFYRGGHLAKVKLQSPRSSPGSCCMKTTTWWFIITSFFICGLPVSNIFMANFQLQLEACWGGVIMTSSWQLEVKIKGKKSFWDRKIHLRNVTMKSDNFVVFIRHDSAEIWWFKYGLTLVIGTKKNIAPMFSGLLCVL